ADGMGRQYGMIAQTFCQGEEDSYRGTDPNVYREGMQISQSGVSSKFKLVSGLPHDIPMVIYQMASHGRYEGLDNPSYVIPLVQLDEALNN
ncbi:hypothetical protein ACV355_29875, partial [Pseudomonas aeruginosa]